MSEISTATMISSAQDQNAPLLRTEFSLEAGHGPVAGAVLTASAQGIFEAYLAGAMVGDDVLSPGWSSYEWRLRYRDYDVTTYAAGENGSCSVSRSATAGSAADSAGVVRGVLRQSARRDR